MSRTELMAKICYTCKDRRSNLASVIVSAKPLPPPSRGSSAGSSNLGTSLDPAHKARDVGEVVLAETMNEANNFLQL